MTNCILPALLGSIPNPLNAARLNNKVCKDFIIDCDLKRKRAATGPTQNPIAAGHRTHTFCLFRISQPGTKNNLEKKGEILK